MKLEKGLSEIILRLPDYKLMDYHAASKGILRKNDFSFKLFKLPAESNESRVLGHPTSTLQAIISQEHAKS